MKRFLIDTAVEKAEGTQTWFVDAETEQEALDKFSSGAGDLYESNVEVTRCGEPEISGEVPLDDFGRFAEQPPVAQPAPVQIQKSCKVCTHEQRDYLDMTGPCKTCRFYSNFASTTPPAAQPAREQEPVAWMTQARNFVNLMEFTEAQAKLYGWTPVYIYTTRSTQGEHMTHTINSTHTAAVATDYYWIPIDANTPRGVKLQLLGNGGVAAYGNYQGAPFWSHWAPLPKRKD
jgi:hypothetical protein